jgi:hypothetical protein
MTIAESIRVAFNSEQEWNKRMLVAGYHAGYLPVPPLRYRIVRAAHLSLMVARENVALAIAPWLDPDGPTTHSNIEAHLS